MRKLLLTILLLLTSLASAATISQQERAIFTLVPSARISVLDNELSGYGPGILFEEERNELHNEFMDQKQEMTPELADKFESLILRVREHKEAE